MTRQLRARCRQMNTGIGRINFPVYSYSKDTPRPLVLTNGTPGLLGGLSASNVATLHTAKGTQVSYKGNPLYFFAFEAIAPSAGGGFAPTGNGNGISLGGGTFRLVTP